MTRECDFCGDTIRGDVYQQVTGWVQTDKRDSLTLRQDVSPPRFSCRACIKRRQLGVSEDQGALI